MLRNHRPFLVLLALFISGVLAYQTTLPPMEGPDEPVHYTYVEHLRATNSLPDRTTYTTNSTRQESGQPPLVYWLAGLPLRVMNFPIRDGEALLDTLYNRIRNRWVVPNIHTDNRRDNLNLYDHGRDEAAFGMADVVTANRIMRLTALALGVLAVIGAYAGAREVFGGSAWALVATGLFAFTPTFLIASSTINNDIGAITFSTLVIWRLLRLLRRGGSWLDYALIGLLLGLGALCKINALLIAPGVAVALMMDAWQRRLSLRQSAGKGLMVAGAFAAVFAPWVAYGVVNYGDPIGINTHQHPDDRYFYAQLLPFGDVASQLGDTYLSYWGSFSPRGTNALSYGLVSGVWLLAAWGMVARRRDWGLRRQELTVLGVMVVVSLVGLVHWMRRQSDVTARLMMPAHLAVALLVTSGLYALAQQFPRFKRPVQLYSLGILALDGLILAPLNFDLTFGLPRLLARADLPPLNGTPVDYDETIRLLGYAQADSVIRGNEHAVTLCWEVLRTTDKPAAFSLKLVHEGEILADRTSVHGLGHYNSVSWRAGDIFCDQFDLFIDDPDVEVEPPPKPGQVYDMLVILLNADTLETDWEATIDGTPVEFPIIGQAVVPAGDMSGHFPAAYTPADVRFPEFARLEGCTLQGTPAPGARIQLDMLWAVEAKTADNWTQFIHLSGGDTGLPLADSVPRGGNYPTWAWSPGEYIADTWTFTLPDDLPPGEYHIFTGFYRQDTGERMPAIQDGQAAPNNAVALFSFRVE
jgi:4-amino-4-deoxy-L-arabinose transferase-like glycosyltransferase